MKPKDDCVLWLQLPDWSIFQEICFRAPFPSLLFIWFMCSSQSLLGSAVIISTYCYSDPSTSEYEQTSHMQNNSPSSPIKEKSQVSCSWFILCQEPFRKWILSGVSIVTKGSIIDTVIIQHYSWLKLTSHWQAPPSPASGLQRWHSCDHKCRESLQTEQHKMNKM